MSKINSKLFSEFKLRKQTFKNRIFVSPMCQYSAVEGLAQDWHLVHLGTRASGGAALVMTEAAAVSPEGRISPEDLGIWSEKHVLALQPVTRFIHSQNAVSAIQLAHAGRKAGTPAPWRTGAKGQWPTLAPSALPFADYAPPKEMSSGDMTKVLHDFEKATMFAQQAGFQVVEIHMAHGYLLHEFLSPLSNHRRDDYGGSLENRMRLPLSIAKKVRDLWPQDQAVFVRISASDWVEGGWDPDQSLVLCKELRKIGIDLIDCSSGGLSADQKIPLAPLYQVPFAEKIKREAQIPTGAVGLITKPQEAEEILRADRADVIFLARELLRNPYWPLKAAHEMGVEVAWPAQYERGKFV